MERLQSNQAPLWVLQLLANTLKHTPYCWALWCPRSRKCTQPSWLRSFIKSIFLHSNHLLAITCVGLMTLIWFNCIHLTVRGKRCSLHSTQVAPLQNERPRVSARVAKCWHKIHLHDQWNSTKILSCDSGNECHREEPSLQESLLVFYSFPTMYKNNKYIGPMAI